MIKKTWVSRFGSQARQSLTPKTNAHAHKRERFSLTRVFKMLAICEP